jgi:ABC-type branched-subunit amino acid transport system permease subunit
MSEQPPASGQEKRAALGGAWAPDPDRRQPNTRRQMAIWGGALAGLGAGIMLACLIHVIEQANPSALFSSFGATILFVVILGGPALGFGLGIMVAGLIPDSERRSQQPAAAAEPGPESDRAPL